MDHHGYKHFSHSHNLIMHQMPEGVEVSCSGCNSSSTGIVYVCWQCNFFLHQQCYRATRSLKHPSHPLHPLTLVPYPTYPSNSFYCNSCEIIGTGFSYSCADCDVDLHVQCAFSISGVPSFQIAHQYHTSYYNHDQELAPQSWNGSQNINMAHNLPFDSVPYNVSIPPTTSSVPNSITNGKYHSTGQDQDLGRQNSIVTSQDPSKVQNGHSVSVPNPITSGMIHSTGQDLGCQNSILTAQDPSKVQNGPSVSVPNPINSGMYHSTGQDLGHQNSILTAQDPSTVQNGPSVSVPNPITSGMYHYTGQDLGRQNSILTAQDPSTVQNGPSVSVPNPIASGMYGQDLGRQNSILTAQDPSTVQNGPSVSVPNPITSGMYHYTGQDLGRQNSILTAQDPSTVQNGPSVSVPNPIASGMYGQDLGRQNSILTAQDPSTVQNGPSVSVPNPITSGMYHSTGQDLGRQNSILSGQDPSRVQNEPSVSVPTSFQNPSADAQYSNMAQKIASISVPAASPETQPESHVESGQNQSSDKEIMHFSHPHNFLIVDLEDMENEVVCSGCEDNLIGKSYSCVEQNCDFHLHESCFHLKKEIQHKSHQEHPLTLSLAPYDNENSAFTCNACFSDGTGFTYHCSVCKFDLHVQCVSLPETAERNDHEHVLKLFYSCPKKDEEEFSCDVCHGAVQKDRWVYYCESCDYCTHLGCVDCKECEGDSVLDAQMQLLRQFHVEQARQNAEFHASVLAIAESYNGMIRF